MSNVPDTRTSPSAYSRFLRVVIERFKLGTVEKQDDITDYRIGTSPRPATDTELRRLAVSLIEMAVQAKRTIEITHVVDYESPDGLGHHLVVISPDATAVKAEQEKLNDSTPS